MHSSAPLLVTDSQPLLPLQSKSELFSADSTWIGAIVPKRWARRAVSRNLIKRQIYSIADHFESSLPHGAHVVRLRSAFDRAHFKSASSEELKKAVRTELEQLFERAMALQVQAEA